MTDLVTELQDLRHLDWALRKMSPGTPGCFLKAYEEQNGQRYYYKLSNYDSYRGVFGHECINELIVSRLLEILQIPHLHYQLLHALICIDGKDQARPAPLFDQGISLLFSCYGNIESIRKYDILEDKAVNNFIGSKSSEYNLRFIPKGLHWFDGRLREHDREKLLSGLDGVLHAEHLEKIWNMLWKRWERYVQICGEE